MGILRLISGVAIILNLLSVGLWMFLNPPATYERLADRDLREAHATYRKVSPEKSYAMYWRIVENYPRSSFAAEARFFGARAAFLGLGRFDEAEKQLTAYLAAHPSNEDHRAEAESYLDLMKNRNDLPAESRDEILWEYVQAVVEDSNGQYRNAATRLEWLVEQYGASAIGRKAGALLPKVAEKLNQAEGR